MLDYGLIVEIKNIINLIILIMVFSSIIGNLENRKVVNKLLNYIIIIVIISIVTILGKLSFALLIPWFIFISTLSLYCKAIYNVSWIKALVYSVLYNCSYIILNSALQWTIILMSKNYNYKIVELKHFISINFILLVIFKYFEKLRDLFLNKKYYLYATISIIGNIMSMLFLTIAGSSIDKLSLALAENKIYIPTNQGENYFIIIMGNILPFILTTSNIFLILTVIKIINDVKIKAENKLINEKLNIQYNHYLAMQESQMKVKKLYHDIKNHMVCIESIKIENRDVNEYINSINNEIKDFQNTYNSESMILDIILNEKSSICEKNNIDFVCDINFSKCNFIEMIDVSSIFANILDNAIEACKKINGNKIDKYINIRGTVVKSYYVIKCENSKTNNVVIKNKKVITSKNDKFVHGIGLQSVRSSLEKYSGELDFEDYEDKFIVKIYIPLNKTNMTVGAIKIPVGS